MKNTDVAGLNSENDMINQVADEQKREFMKKFGNFAATVPVGMFVLMSVGTSKAHAGSDVVQTKSQVSSDAGPK